MFLWLIYIDDLSKVVRHAGLSLFIDDVALWISHPDPKEAIRLLNSDLASIYNWSIFNTVCFDASKFHLLDMGKKQLSQDLMDSVLFGTEQPKWSPKAVFLGVTLDTKLDLVREMKERAIKAERAQFRLLNHARQRDRHFPSNVECNIHTVCTFCDLLWQRIVDILAENIFLAY